jgi:EAL domain-containing protein (putative c-di-GMP-specific phosphodiesterase class I)
MQGYAHTLTNERLQGLLIDALTRDPHAAGFDVHYQPIVRMRDEAITAVEALARWHHPVIGPIEPGRFIAAAEHCGLVDVIDDFVLNRTCADAQVLDSLFGAGLNLHVNVSASRLGHVDLESAIVRALKRHGTAPGRLVIEITETCRITDLRTAADSLTDVRKRGVRVALDDFGSGFNSLQELLALRPDVIKLDAALTREDAEPAHAEVLCRSVLAICRHMGLTVVAEGIENEQQAGTFRRMECHCGQGYLFGRPAPLDAASVAQPRVHVARSG